jgi:acyl-coenzyme A thioesterase PaaI-like protein
VLKVLRSNWKFRLFLLKDLPSLFFWGIKVREIDADRAEIVLPFSWRTKNPFRSIYFSALAGAAELATGLLVLQAVEGKNMSFLVVGTKGNFIKKATTKTVFVCDEGKSIKAAVESAISTGEGAIFAVRSTGYNADNEAVAEFEFTWSVKTRK